MGVSASAPARSPPLLTGMDGFSLLQSAISVNPTSHGMLHGRVRCVQMLLEAKAPPILPGSEPGPDQFVALRTAIARGDSQLVSMLLNAGGKPTDESLYNTILANALETLTKHARNPKIEMQDLQQRLACTQLVVMGQPFAPTREQARQVLLNCACQQGSSNVCELLLNERADPNVVPISARLLPLMIAVDSRHAACVKVLLQHAANPSMTAQDGRTAMAIAREHGDVECVRLLLNAFRHGKQLEGKLVEISDQSQVPVIIGRRGVPVLVDVAGRPSTPLPVRKLVASTLFNISNLLGRHFSNLFLYVYLSSFNYLYLYLGPLY
jgi:ankyrin repeat protein